MSTSTKNAERETPTQKQARLRGEGPRKSSSFQADGTTGTGIALRDSVNLTVSSDGYCVFDCNFTICGDNDFVGVYANSSLPQSENLGNAWEWASHVDSFPYKSNVQAQEGYVVIYWSKDYVTNEYVQVCYSDSLPNGNAGTTVTGTSI